MAAHVALLFVNILVLALSARVNLFQEFFFMADLFPLALSIVTLVLLTFSILLDIGVQNPITGRAPFEVGLFSILTVLWLAFNAFSTSRWQHVPLACASIPAEYGAEIVWCKDLQALKSFVWIEWVMFLLITLVTLRYAITQSNAGQKHIWSTALTHYEPKAVQDPVYGDEGMRYTFNAASGAAVSNHTVGRYMSEQKMDTSSEFVQYDNRYDNRR